ncbi:putative L-type lectin-domain containing receptor kinase S.5 [Acorus gramineus]|uniref:L-type lectin-domain containing receptor kinase S.5 n=1 Tax=Acorus gramineus TaxID=55184 RepID=A0AAV9A749_ACOGR|nr:putative L-type lectin-domain containing receptor kinase S.5 [Acorus gramineus]
MAEPSWIIHITLLSIILLSHPPIQTAQTLNTTTYTFGPFYRDSPDFDKFRFLGDAGGMSAGALQITQDSRNSAEYLVNKSGRVMFTERFRLYNPKKTRPTTTNTSTMLVASFNTTFDINIYRTTGTVPGEGIAFIIAPDLSKPPLASYGGYLGLTNSTTDGDPSNQIIAIELDTGKQSYDPVRGDHVGLDINSVVSNATASLADFNIEIAPVNATNHTVWINYDGISRRLFVYMAKQFAPKPTKPLLVADVDLSKHVNQYSHFGFAASTGNDYELNCVLGWNLTVEVLPEERGLSGWRLSVVVVASAVVVGVVVGVGFMLLKKRRLGREDMQYILGKLKSLPGMPREFRFVELKRATNNFDGKNKLGEGGFGIVYKGVLEKEKVEVAVKKFSREKLKGKDDFLAELTIINRLRHKHLVRLVGWCHKNGMLLLVYDFMPNGSLDAHLYGEGDPLPWSRRYTVLADVASALTYLHDEYDQRVLHRDLKASNILLDSHFNARLGDFGLARALDNEKTSYMEAEGCFAGTPGYIAPECFHTQKATCESDVFGFGAVILEVVCGRRPYDVFPGGFKYLADWVWTLYREGRILEAVDKKLEGEYSAEDAERLLLLGLACSHPIAAERPKTQAIAQIIYRSVPPPAVPRIKPAFIWPMVGSLSIDSGSYCSGTTTTRRSSSSNCVWPTIEGQAGLGEISMV